MTSSKKIKICIFTSVHPWNDVRIFYKQATSLAKRYSVELHAPAEFDKKTINKLTVRGLPLWENKRHRVKTFFILLKRIWTSEADIFHFHDPELIVHGLILKIFRRKKVIFDVHENTIQLIKDRSWISYIYKKPLSLFYLGLEKLAPILFDKIILAEESYRSFIPNNSEVILNFPLVSHILKDQKKQTDAIYVGGVLKERGAFELLKIANYVVDEIPTFLMKIVGPVGNTLLYELKKYIKINNLKNNVIITGAIDHSLAMEEVKKAKIGLAILHPIGNYLNSLPTKLFEYMCYGLPFIASDFEYWKRFFNGEKAGYFVPYDNTQYSADKIITLLTDDHLRNQLGVTGKELVKEEYEWLTEEKKLFTIYDTIIANIYIK
jgi:glycosyltransferase involved in cell wall biosynthesis|tara:strand:+ start:596 stop:1729 length:1134 start_codon:yes stop_codon:yes gene_type:complete